MGLGIRAWGELKGGGAETVYLAASPRNMRAGTFMAVLRRLQFINVLDHLEATLWDSKLAATFCHQTLLSGMEESMCSFVRRSLFEHIADFATPLSKVL